MLDIDPNSCFENPNDEEENKPWCNPKSRIFFELFFIAAMGYLFLIS